MMSALRPHGNCVAGGLELADHPDIDTARGLLLEQLDELRVLDVHVIDQQLMLGALDERGQRVTCRFGRDSTDIPT